jgi:hypothetical protein
MRQLTKKYLGMPKMKVASLEETHGIGNNYEIFITFLFLSSRAFSLCAILQKINANIARMVCYLSGQFKNAYIRLICCLSSQS